jgi:hypothetical protein
MAWFAGLYLAAETVIRVPYFKSIATGWKIVSILGIGFTYKTIFSFYNSYTYGPIVSAYLRKHFKLARYD